MVEEEEGGCCCEGGESAAESAAGNHAASLATAVCFSGEMRSSWEDRIGQLSLVLFNPNPYMIDQAAYPFRG